MAGIELIVWLQEQLPWLTPVMLALTFLGDEEFYVLVFPLLYWSVSPRLGVRVGVVLLVSAGLNTAAKFAGGSPRPFWVSDEVAAYAVESSYGTPSGHAQDAAAVWGRVAAAVPRAGLRVAMVVLIVLIGVSRWQLGVHFPVDTLVGWAVGLALLGLALALEPRVVPWLRARSVPAQMLAGVGASLALLAFAVAARWAGPGAPPQQWLAQARAAAPADEPIDPTALSGAVTPAGALLGLAVGLALLGRRGGFDATGSTLRRAARYPVGLAGVALLYLGLGGLLPEDEGAAALAGRYAQFALVGLWIAAGGPLAFAWLRLSPSRAPPPASADASA